MKIDGPFYDVTVDTQAGRRYVIVQANTIFGAIAKCRDGMGHDIDVVNVAKAFQSTVILNEREVDS